MEQQFIAYVTVCLRRHASRWKRQLTTHYMRESLTLNGLVSDSEGHTSERVNLEVADPVGTPESFLDMATPDQMFGIGLFNAFRTLTERQQQTLILLLVRQMRQQDVARHFGVSQQVVCRSKTQALQRLRTRLSGRR